MLPIVAPQPRTVSSNCSESTIMPSHTVPPRAPLSPLRLMSPILLADRPSSFNSKPSSRNVLRRRSVLNHSQRRRRHCARAECRFDPTGAPAFFDNLPWISALETSPDHSSDYDIADLSQIPFDQGFRPAIQSSGPGPIRRRKVLPRSSPLASDPEHIHNCTLFEPTPFPFRVHRDNDYFASSPCTPLLTFICPSRVCFHNLMPVILDPHNDEHPFRCHVNHPHCWSPSSSHHCPASS